MCALTSNQPLGIFRECSNPECRFRYADMRLEKEIDFCPKCGEVTYIRNRGFSQHYAQHKGRNQSHSKVAVLLDNIRSVYNVGSIFRTCEGLGVKEIFLAGITPTPNHPRLSKTGLGAENLVNWRYENNAVDMVHLLHQENYLIIGLECMPDAENLRDLQIKDSNQPLCLVVGNERLGIDPDVLNLCNHLVCIPMQGTKQSFNVSVAFAIAAYHLLEILQCH